MNAASSKTHVLLISDVHLCHLHWHGLSSEDRLEKMISDLNAYYRENSYEAILFLGDYSLDFWKFHEGGSYFHHRISNTERFCKTYLPRLECRKILLLPGNHEQYDPQTWKSITGFERRFSAVLGNALFLMLDNFAGDLSPAADSDGVYSPCDVAWIRQELARHPALPVFLCAHHFDLSKETPEFAALLREESRILGLFCGHDHTADTTQLDERFGKKYLFRTGNYSYCRRPMESAWGWRDLVLGPNGAAVRYYCPESRHQLPDGSFCRVPAGFAGETFLPFPKH